LMGAMNALAARNEIQGCGQPQAEQRSIMDKRGLGQWPAHEKTRV
jgi:hypothetical protein